ncbi:putative oxidoreductase [Klebsiella pneumoniae subsp. rhinoscleromatis]|nr:putative oxidoreductase [Klebsiella pneumoniae subsp. rhinoscleromatis]
MADHTKLNRCEPWRVAGLSDIHHLFLDRPWAELGMTPPSLYILLTLNNVENLMSNNTINIALIGYGFVGKTFHAPLIRSVPGLNLAFVASRDEEKVKRDLPDVTVIASPEAAVQHPDVDLVVIASPNATHAPLARLALNVGKHVVVDKPFTLDMQEARELIALAEEKQRLLSVFHNRRWDSDYLGIRQVIEQGTLGAVKHFGVAFRPLPPGSPRPLARAERPGQRLVVRPGAAPYRPGAAAIWFAAVGAR